ncbi:MAG: hypothetical protein LC776_10430 [Acidobacteria bacterium]|nr:hypothetical protein [Acidobacteriota bacterium]
MLFGRYKIGKCLPVSDAKHILTEAKRTGLYARYVLAVTRGLRRDELFGCLVGPRSPLRHRRDSQLLMDDSKSENSDNTHLVAEDHMRVLMSTVIAKPSNAPQRHTGVSLLLQLRTPPHVVQRIARHADLAVTLGIYPHTNLTLARSTRQ